MAIEPVIVTPFGPRSASRVRQLGPGQALSYADGTPRRIDARTGVPVAEPPLAPQPAPLQAPTFGWIMDASWTQTSPAITQLRATFTVPPPPSVDTGQLLYLFPGIQNLSVPRIVQPVLQWGPNGSFGGSYWCIANWVADASSGHYAGVVTVSPGDSLTGLITLTGGSYNYLSQFIGYPTADLSVTAISLLSNAVMAFEAYTSSAGTAVLTDCTNYPNSAYTEFGAISVQAGGGPVTPAWTPVVNESGCGQHVVIVSPSDVQLVYGPAPVPVPSGPSFYRNFDTLSGLSYDGSEHHQFGFPFVGATDSAGNPITGGIDWIRGLLSSTDNRATLYAWAFDPDGSNCFMYRSTDSGASWTQRGQFAGRNGQSTDANGTTYATTDSLWNAVHTDNAFTSRRDGVWRSTDGASSWSRILNCEGQVTVNSMSGSTPTSQNAPRGCFATAIGSSKLWFVWEVSGVYSNSPYPSPPQGTALYRIEQANLDGSARTTLGEITLYAHGDYNTAHDNVQLPLRPWGDSFALIPSSVGQFSAPPIPGVSMLWKVDSSGVHQLTWPGGLVLDAVPLSTTTWLLLTYETSADTVTIYRTIDAGTTWGITRVLSGHEYPGWGSGGAARADSRGCWMIAPTSGSNDVFVMGGQGSHGPGGSGINQTAPLVTWYSNDLGASWSAIVDESAPVDTDGFWMLGVQLGICPGVATPLPSVAVPSRLATIVG